MFVERRCTHRGVASPRKPLFNSDDLRGNLYQVVISYLWHLYLRSLVFVYGTSRQRTAGVFSQESSFKMTMVFAHWWRLSILDYFATVRFVLCQR